MALVTVQRSPSSSNSSSTISISETDDDSEDRLKKSCSSFFAVKGAALFLPRGTDCRPIKKNPVVGDLQVHLQSMFILLRPQDSIILAVRLESIRESRIRYLVLISCIGVEDTEENVILGLDVVKRNATIGLVLPVWAETKISLNGDGGFTIKAKNRLHIFKPVSVQAMWSALQALNKACETARKYTYFSGGLNLTWTGYYESRVLSKVECVKEWHMLPDIESHESVEHRIQKEGDLYRPSARELTERLISVKLREVLLSVDIEEVTSKEIRTRLEEVVGNNLREFKEFIDEEMIIFLRQMDSASQIFDFLYLGSEWNAGNLVELEQNGIGYILNVTKEIDNFFPGRFKYHNIRLYDVESSDLLRHWEDTHRFLSKAKEAGSKAFVHCKMGISRSAATVIAFAMKENRWTLDEALKYVKEKRRVINPNKGFRQQLEEYQGILDASNQRHNKLWRSKSESSLSTASSAESNIHMADIHLGDINPADLQPSISEESSAMCDPRRRSWSPNERTSDALLGPSPEVPEDSRSAISSPMYLDSPTAHYGGAGFAIGDGGVESASDDEEWREIKIAVPEVPLSPTQSGVSQFPPAGNVIQKIYSIEGVTTSESTEEAVKVVKVQKDEEAGVDQAMVAAEDPGKFIIEGAITGESTEDDFATTEPGDIETGQLAGEIHVDTKVPCEEEDKEGKVSLEGATAAPEQTSDFDEGRKTPINFPMYLPLAEGGYMFPPDADIESVTSSTAVNVDDDDDDYIKKACFEDEDILEEDDIQDDNVNLMPEVPGAKPDPDRLLSPEEKDVFFTPEEGVLPVLQPSESQEEPEVPTGIEQEQSKAASGYQDKEDILPQAQGDEDKTTEEVEEVTPESDTIPSSQQLHLDIDTQSQTELNTNNNSSNENSPRDAAIASVPVTKDFAHSIVKACLSPLERRNVSLLSSASQSPDSPESDGYKTASSDTAETPNASPMVYAKEYPKGSVRSRARSYETQISGDSEDQSVADTCKPEASTVVQVSAVEAPEKQSISPSVGAVLKQRKDIEERLKSESESESSPPLIRSAKFFTESSQIDAPKGPNKSELSPPPSDSVQEKSFASPSLQSLEKGIVKKITKQLLSSETTLTKETSETKTVDTAAPHLDSSLADSSNSKVNRTVTVDKNQGKSEQVASNENAPDNDREKTIESSSASETLLEPTKKDSETTDEPLPEQASEEETVVLRKKEPTYSRFGDEKIPLEPGIVKRHTQDFEQRSVEKLKEETEMMEKTSPTESETPDEPLPAVETLDASPDVSVEVQPEVTEPGAESAYPEEGSTWRVGDVRRHKKVFEEMKGADGAELLDSSKPSTVKMSQDSWEKKLTPEELENIKELGKIVLGRSDDPESDEEGDEEEEEEEEEEEMMEQAEGGEPPEDEGRFIAVNERIKKLELGIDKPKPSHVDLKRSSSIARMSSEKISPTSARRRYERRKVIIRSKSDIDSGGNSPTTDTTVDGTGSPRNNQPTIKEMERESSTSSLDKEDPEVIVAGATAREPQETQPSPRERLRSKSDGQTEEPRTSYKETFEESTQDAEIQRVLSQAHEALLKKPPPQLGNTSTQGASSEQANASAQGTSHKRKRNHGNSHPLAKLTASARKHPFYSTM